MAKKDKNKNEPVVRGAAYEEEKKRHPILNFLIILFAVLLVIDAALLVFWFVKNGLPKNPNYVVGEYTLVEDDTGLDDGESGKITLTLTWNAETETGRYVLSVAAAGSGAGDDDDDNTGDDNTGDEGDDNTGDEGDDNTGDEGGEGDDVTDAASRAAAFLNGEWTYADGVVTFKSGSLRGDYQFAVPIFGKDTLTYDEAAGKTVFRKK